MVECPIDAGDAGGEGDARQPGARVECKSADVGDAVGDGDTRQSGAVTKCITADAGDADGEGVNAHLARRILNQRGQGLIEEHAVQAAVARIGRSHRDCCQPGAVAECPIADAGDTVGEAGTRQSGAVVERLPADAGDTGGEGDARQPAAGEECHIADAGDAAGEGDARQPAANFECVIADAGDAGGECVSTLFAARILNQRGQGLVEEHALQAAVARVGSVHHDLC